MANGSDKIYLCRIGYNVMLYFLTVLTHFNRCQLEVLSAKRAGETEYALVQALLL